MHLLMKKTLLSLIVSSFFGFANAAVTDTINVTIPGTLGAGGGRYFSTVTNLTVTGIIDARDFLVMKAMPVLSVLNLSNVTITAYTGAGGTVDSDNIAYAANEIPPYAFNSPPYCIECPPYINTTLTSITLPTNITSIGDHAFANCKNLKGTLTIPSSVTYIGSTAFGGCSFTGTLNIPSSVTYIGDYAFGGCPLLGNLTIPSSVTFIGDYAFSYCFGLTSIIDLNPVPLNGNAMGDRVFEQDTIKYLYVPCGSVTAYETDSNWNNNGYYNFNIVANNRFVPIYASADSVISGTSVTFTANTGCISASPTLQWQVNGINSGTGINTFTYVPENNDTITCNAFVNDTLLPSNTIVMKVTGGTGVIDNTGSDVTLYPIPVSANLTISFPDPQSQTSFSIYSMYGIEVYSTIITNPITTADLSKYAPGVYIVKIKSQHCDIIYRKVIKQ
jgi:hypothetical protein